MEERNLGGEERNLQRAEQSMSGLRWEDSKRVQRRDGLARPTRWTAGKGLLPPNLRCFILSPPPPGNRPPSPEILPPLACHQTRNVYTVDFFSLKYGKTC